MGEVVSHRGCAEEDNNIVNQMWLLLHSKPCHLPPLTHTEGRLFCKPAATDPRAAPSLDITLRCVCTVYAQTVMHLLEWILWQKYG